jgi:hypothetical protein
MSKVSLVELANLRFSDLSETESSVLLAVENGQEAAATSPSIIRAEMLEWLCTDKCCDAQQEDGLSLRPATDGFKGKICPA